MPQPLALPAPKNDTPSLEHFAVVILDASTLLITGHYMEEQEGCLPYVTYAQQTVHLAQPITTINDSFLNDEGNEGFKPCGISDFYAHVDDETHAWLMTSEGRDPVAEFAKWAKQNEELDLGEPLDIAEDATLDDLTDMGQVQYFNNTLERMDCALVGAPEIGWLLLINDRRVVVPGTMTVLEVLRKATDETTD